MSNEAADCQLTTIDSATLVERLVDPHDEDAWREVEGRYGPLVHAFARRLGLSRELAGDAHQNTMLAIVETVRAGRFDRSRGRLRSLLFSIARNEILDLRRKEAPRTPASPLGEADAPHEDALEREFQREWQVAVAARALREAQEHFSPETYRIFYVRVIAGMSSAEVAGECGVTIGAVDSTVHRVRAYLRTVRRRLEEVF